MGLSVPLPQLTSRFVSVVRAVPDVQDFVVSSFPVHGAVAVFAAVFGSDDYPCGIARYRYYALPMASSSPFH
jgi:hypothetical protein